MVEVSLQEDGEKIGIRGYFLACWREFTSVELYYAGISEMVGTSLFLFVSLKVVSTNPFFEPPAGHQSGGALLASAISVGLALALFLWAFTPVSRGYFNPAITIMRCVLLEISVLRAFVLVAMQILGSLVAALLNFALTPNSFRIGSAMGAALLHPNLSDWQGFLYEMFGGVITAIAILALKKSTNNLNSTFLIGSSAVLVNLMVFPWTGSDANPARAFGPNIIATYVNNIPSINSSYWLYWAGPIFGAVLAAVVYEFAFSTERRSPSSRLYMLPTDNWRERLMSPSMEDSQKDTEEDLHLASQRDIEMEIDVK